ncbi:hypothetical protein WP50_29375, partial [Lactiplantibacillus plantarum]
MLVTPYWRPTSDQSGAFLLAALLTCVISPLIFNKFYSAEKEDLVKTAVHFIGANLSTVPVAQQLRKGWYDVSMYTNHPENYQTYHAQVPVTLMENFTAQDLQDHGVFDTDILAALTATTMTMVLAVLRVAKSMKTITSDQSGAFLLAALLTCVISPLIFNKFYSAEKEDLVKTAVHFIGANLSTVPVAQQLRKGWYDVSMYTNHPENYQTYHAQVPVTLMENFTAQDLQDHGVFDTDILVLGHIDAERNYELAKAAKAYGVRRLIVRFDDRTVLNEHEDELRELGVEVYNTPEATITLLRALLDSPSTLLLLNDT